MRVQVHGLSVAAFGAMALAWCAGVHGLSATRQELMEAVSRTPNLDRGAELFQACAACHGADGGGTRDGQVPRIAGQHAAVLAKQLVDYRHNRRWDPRMQHVADPHRLADAQAIADVAAYISQLSGEPVSGQGNGQLLAHGAAAYASLCARCHGASGEGNARRYVPRLAGQHYEYLRRQFHDAVEGRRPNFSAAHIRLLARLDYDDIAAIADYLSRLPETRTGPGSRRE
jgi:cytochrome c553